MNKTTTRILLLSLFVLTFLNIGAQDIDIINTEPSSLVCPGGTAKIVKDTTESYPYTYQYWDGESWACCFGGNQTPYHISIPATGQWVEVQRKYTNGVAEFKRESVGFFYTPVTPQIEAVPYPGTCNTNTGRIVVTDRSTNFSTMPRRFKLYDQNNVLRGNIVVDTSIYSFVNLPAGTYRVIVETPCNSVYSEKTDIIVTTSSQNPVLDIALSGHDDCLENNINASIILPESIPTTGVQYRMDGGTWQSSATFTNVTPWLTHQFSARLSGCFEANTTQFVSELSIPRIQSLERAKDTDCTPANNEIRVFVPEGSDAQIQFNHSGGWYNPGQWIGPLPDGSLHIRARSAYLPSCYRDTLISLSEHGSVNLIGADASNLTDCTLGNISLQLRTEPAVSAGLEYFVEGKGWQNSAQFNGLNNGNKHIAIRGTGLCQVGIGADTIALNEIIPPQIESIAPHGHDDCVIGNAGFTVYLVQSVAGVKYRINGGAWQEGNLFQNRPAGNYLVEVARADGSCLSSQNFALVETGSVSITGLSKANENDCVVGNAQFQVLHTGGTQEGLKFRLNGGAWQDSAIFRNLTRMALNVETQIQKPTCTSSIVAWPDSIREQSSFPRIDATVISNDKDCTAGNAKVTISLKSPMTATYWLSASKNNTTGIFTGLSSGTYTFEVYQSRSGCIDRRTVVIDEKLGFTLDSLRVQGGEDCLNNNAQVVVFHRYGNDYGLQFREVSRNTPWQNSNAFPLSTHGVGQYNLEARNANGCAVWSGSIYGQERLNPEISGVVGIDGLSDCALGNVTAQVQLLNSSAGTTKQYRLNGGAWNLSNTLPGFRHGSNLVELTYNFGGLGTQQCTINKTIIIDEKAKEITGVLLDAATLNDCNLNNVKATIQVDGSTSNLRYVVTSKTEGTSNMFTGLNNGQYKAIIRDVVSTCRDTMVFTIAETPALAVPTPTVQQVICYGAATGSISTSPTGGVAPYTYLWSTGATSASVTGLAAGTYGVTVSDSRGCSLSQTAQVTGPTQSNLPQISFTGSTAICAGESFSLSASGGGSYAWSTGTNSSSISGSPTETTTYTVTVTNGLGCSASASRTITVNALPVPNIEGINTICAGQSTTLTATGGSTYAWQHGAIEASITVNPTSTTTYKVTVTNAEQCSAIYNRTVRVNALPVVQIAGAPTGPLCGTSVVVLTATGGTTYKWGSGETTATISRIINNAISFGVTGKDINGCEASAGGTISVIPRPQAQILGGDIPCRGNSTVLTAIGGSSYLWSNNATTSSIAISQPTQNQTYSVTVSNGPGCSSVDYKTVVVPAAFTLGYSLEQDQDCTPNNTQIVPAPSNAQGNVSYVLAPLNTFDFSTSLSGWGTGQYTLSAIDGKGCMADTTVVVNEAPALQVQANISGDTLDCLRGNVQVSLSSTGARGTVSYHFDSPQSAILAPSSFNSSSLQRWVYAVDTLGCRDSLDVVVDERLPYDLRAYQRNTEDCNPNNTAIAAYGHSARGVLSFQLDEGTPQTDSLFSNVAPGAHRLYFIDSLGCRDSFYIQVANEAQLLTGVQGVSRCDTADAVLSIYASPSSAATQYQYSIDAGQNWQTSQEFTDLPPGLYIPALKKLPAGCIITGDTLVISDTCRSYALAGFTKDTVMITQPDQLVLFPWLVETPRWMQDDFNLKLVLQGTGEPHFVEYNPDGTNANLRSERLFAQRQYLNGFDGPDKDSTALASTARLFNYPQEYIFSLQSVTPTKLKIDPKRKDLRVIVVFDPETYSEVTVIICKGESTTLDARPGSCFNWNDGSTENPRTVSPTEDTEYSVTVLDDKLQARVIRYKVIVLDVDPEITVETNPDELCEDGPIKLKASPVGAQYTYLWNTGATTAEISVSSSSLLNLYRVTVTESREDSEGNVKTCAAVVEMGKEEILAAAQSEKWNAVFDKLVELGFKPYPCRLIKAPAFRATPELRDACTGVEDNTTVTEIEWDATIVDLKQRVCDDVTAANAAGFGARGYLFDGICHPSFQQIMSDVRTDLHNMDQVIVYLDRKDSDEDVFFQYFEEYDKFIEEAVVDKLDDKFQDLLIPCGGTRRLGYSGFLDKSWRSWWVQYHIIKTNPWAIAEYQVPQGDEPGPFTYGYVDIAIPVTSEIFEIKSALEAPLPATLTQVRNYVENANKNCGLGGRLWKRGTNFTPLVLEHLEDPLNKILYVELHADGIIKYTDMNRRPGIDPVPLPLFVPNHIVKKIKDFIEELKKLKEIEWDKEIEVFLRENPGLVKYVIITIKTIAYTILVATIIEDIITLGVGVADDVVTIAIATRLLKLASQFKLVPVP